MNKTATKKELELTELNKFLTNSISTEQFAEVLDEIGHNFSLFLIENPDRFETKQSSNWIDLLRDFKLIIKRIKEKE